MIPVAINPEALGMPRGYSHGMLAPAGGRVLAVAGQVGWNARQEIVGDDFAQQFGQALDNVLTVVRAAGGRPEHLVQLTLFVTDHREYLAAAKDVGREYRERMGKHFPAMAGIEIQALLEPGAKVEIQGLAVLPGDPA